MLRLYHSPLACSLASRFALVEAGVPHEIVFIRTWLDEQRSDEYRKINPCGKVPALETEHGVLIESPAILEFVADLAPDRDLIPKPASFERAQATSWLCYLSSTLHPALGAVMFPAEGCQSEAAIDDARGRLELVLLHLDRHVGSRDTLLQTFSVCDLFLAVFLLWRGAAALSGRLPDYNNLDRLQQSVLSRHSFGAIVHEEFQMRSEAAS